MITAIRFSYHFRSHAKDIPTIRSAWGLMVVGDGGRLMFVGDTGTSKAVFALVQNLHPSGLIVYNNNLGNQFPSLPLPAHIDDIKRHREKIDRELEEQLFMVPEIRGALAQANTAALNALRGLLPHKE